MKHLRIEPRGDFSPLLPLPDQKGSWFTTQTIVFHSERLDRLIVIPKGSHNDLASIPRPARMIFPVNAPHRIAAIIHDYLYGVKGKLYDGEVVTREQADDLFYDVMRISGQQYLEWIGEAGKDLLQVTPSGKESFRRLQEADHLVGKITAETMHSAVRIGGWSHWS